MTIRAKGVAVLAVQMALVLSIAAKYAWERHVCPMVWTRATQFDPQEPLRGRYLALQLRASACGLSKNDAENAYINRSFVGRKNELGSQGWTVVPRAENGRLVARPGDPKRPDQSEHLMLNADEPCEYAILSGETEFFVSEHAKTPFPLAKGQELWALVTVPPSGPPRPVRLAVSDGKEFRVLDLP